MKRAKAYFSRVTKAAFRKLQLHDSHDPNSYIGRKVMARRELDLPDEEIVVSDVKGCVAEHLQKYFQINGTHFCHMFSFFTQMLESRVPSDEEMAEFELASQVKKIREIKDGQAKKGK